MNENSSLCNFVAVDFWMFFSYYILQGDMMAFRKQSPPQLTALFKKYGNCKAAKKNRIKQCMDGHYIEAEVRRHFYNLIIKIAEKTSPLSYNPTNFCPSRKLLCNVFRGYFVDPQMCLLPVERNKWIIFFSRFMTSNHLDSSACNKKSH